MEEPLLTVGTVARSLSVDPSTIRRWITHGTLEAIELPSNGIRKAYRIRRSTLDAILAAPSQECTVVLPQTAQ